MAQHRPPPRALLDRRGGCAPLLQTAQTPASAARKRSPKPPRAGGPRTLYRPKDGGNARQTTKPPPLPPPPRPPVEDAQLLLQRLSSWEKTLGDAQDGDDGVEEARAALRRTCVELIKAYPKTARKLNVSEKLWRSWYREMEGQSPSVLAACSTFYSKLTEQLESSLRQSNRLSDHVEGLKHSLQVALVALGDVTRYEQNRREKGETRDWTAARKYYERALEVAPSNGKVYNQLGLLAVLEGKLLDGAYFYARSLVCEAPFATSGNLLHVLQRGKSAEKQLQIQQQSGTPSCEAMETFVARSLTCLYMILAGKEPKLAWDEALQRVQAALVHLLDICDQQDETMPIDGPLLRTLSSTLTRIVCLVIVLTHSTQHTIGEVSTRRALDEGFDNWSCNELFEKPLSICNAIIIRLLSKLVSLLPTSSESTRTKYFANALLPSLNIYLEWLNLHQALLRQTEATLQEKCAALFHTLSANGFIERSLFCVSKRDDDLSSAILPEDCELRGFLPYEKALKARFPEDITPGQCLPRQLTEEERLVLRAKRFMAFSERFVFSGKPPMPTASVPVKPLSEPRASKGGATKSTTAIADPLAIDPVHSGRLCILCSNTSTFADGECEFCGYEDEDYDADTVSDDGDSAIQSSWIQQYDLAYNNNDSSLGRRPPSEHSPSRDHFNSSPTSSPRSELPPVTLETDFKTIMSIGTEHADYQDGLAADKKGQQQLIVIDAPNVAMRHGKGKVFSCAGIELAVNYFQALGHRVVAFIPDYMLQSDEERAQREEQGEVLTAAKIPDDVPLLERLVNKGVLIPTPPQDYDDSYSIQYAGLHDGYVVTNDLFRDHIINMVGPRERKVAMRAWLRAHQISYSWVRNEFLPNPNFRFPDASGM